MHVKERSKQLVIKDWPDMPSTYEHLIGMYGILSYIHLYVRILQSKKFRFSKSTSLHEFEIVCFSTFYTQSERTFLREGSTIWKI
jgi:hypothetical protein